MSQLHREFPEATPEEIETKAIAALAFAPRRFVGPLVERECWECGRTHYSQSRKGGKWMGLCGWCIAHHC